MHHILRPAWYAFLSTRQSASAFNQPLSLDDSSVTDMQGMFHVRSPVARAAALYPLAHTSSRIVRPPFRFVS